MTSIFMSSVLAVPVLAQTALAWWAIVFFIIAVVAYLLGAQGVASAARPGLVAVDMSTIQPAAARDIAARLSAQGVDFLEIGRAHV